MTMYASLKSHKLFLNWGVFYLISLLALYVPLEWSKISIHFLVLNFGNFVGSVSMPERFSIFYIPFYTIAFKTILNH